MQRDGDELVIRGYSLAQRLLSGLPIGPAGHGDGPNTSESGAPGLLRGGEYTSHHDHRMVMALKVAALGADGPIIIDDEDCVAKSFPSFRECYGHLWTK